MKNKRKIAVGAAALAVVLVSAGTFAWFSTTDKTEPNIFQMDNFDVTVTEDFDTPDVPLNPGMDVTKEVGVTNAGNVDVLVRVKLEEALSLLVQDDTDGVDKLKVEYLADKADAAGAQYVPVSISDAMITAYTKAGYASYSTNTPTDVTVYRKETTNGDNTVYSYLAYVTDTKQLVQVTPQGDNAATPDSFNVMYAYNERKDAGSGQYTVTATHGKDDEVLDTYYADGTFHDVVTLNFAANVQTDGAALGTDTVWYLADDGYFYYTKALKGESISEPLLQSVSIREAAGNALKGATYTITPVMQAVQVGYDAAAAT
ncbi:BsaA family SipW-dependent biofilm matrix protein [uncultured Flavonifractor sp.]|uniref:BsaA family SipW-dependent biofilm matrix protein n=1 Tax=uncultured Flavonifractor sp. TaxID=1193534 RepID=UPI00262575EC|nr:BsaA family SipW-dependent biofilm matrix protein [uncultured Flavonifractor sp.]